MIHLAYRTIYGTKALEPIRIGLPSLRVDARREKQNKESLLKNPDLLEKTRDEARAMIFSYQ